ncbi:MAG: LysE family transporter [Thermomicrobiales bacterium]|nr:LysE family transporter [Thermomicrobiales bacterium]
MQILLQGMGVGVALAAPIGPINIEIIRRGLRGGFLNGWLVGLGAMTADTIFCALVVSGATPLADNPVVRIPLYLLGAAVLLFLGVSGLIAAVRGAETTGSPPSGRRSFVAGFMMAVGNPMGIVYWLSIGAALIAGAIEQAGREAGPVLVAGVFSGILLWVTALSGLTRAGREFVSPRIMRVISAAGAMVLVGFGLFFLWSGLRGLAAL